MPPWRLTSRSPTTSWSRRAAGAAGAAALAVAATVVSGTAWAQSQREWRLQALGTVAPEPFAGGGASFTLRARTRVGLSLTGVLGARAGRVAGRGEALLSFFLDPFRRRGLGPYAAGGIAVVGDAAGTQEYLVALLGVASNPAGSRGWFAEAGAGGGLRLSVGVAFRRASAR